MTFQYSKVKKLLQKEPKYRLDQVNTAIFENLIENWDEVTTLSKDLRRQLKEEASLKIEARDFESKDKQSQKALIKLHDGSYIESVLMRYKKRNTVCISSQVGCPVGCKFCATGRMGFSRNLTVDEIILQLLYFARILNKEGKRVSNVVFMGMGEPFLNYEVVIGSIRFINNQDTFGIGARRISVSTVGIPDKIREFAEFEIDSNLAISLHAADNELRSKLIPVNEKWPIEEVLKAVDYYLEKKNRKVMFEYILLKDVNDSMDDALKLARLLRGKLCMLNLIPANPVGEIKPSTDEKVETFRDIVTKNGIEVIQRYSFGTDINAACGQLAVDNLD